MTSRVPEWPSQCAHTPGQEHFRVSAAAASRDSTRVTNENGDSGKIHYHPLILYNERQNATFPNHHCMEFQNHVWAHDLIRAKETPRRFNVGV